MPQRLDAKLGVLPAAQREIWSGLSPAPGLDFVLYGGTAIALHLGHRESLDFDFFRSERLDKDQLRAAFGFVNGAAILQDAPDTLAVLVEMPSGPVKISFFGGIAFGRVNDPLPTRDGILLVASLDDLMATKLKATLDRAEAKDYRDIAAMIAAGGCCAWLAYRYLGLKFISQSWFNLDTTWAVSLILVGAIALVLNLT